MKSFLNDPLEFENIREFLELEYDRFNRKSFIEADPISIPHLYSIKEDIEISGFITATIAWGQRPVILRNALRFMEWMDNSPAEFVKMASNDEISKLSHFVHRTFNGMDAVFFVHALRRIYLFSGGLEKLFMDSLKLHTGRMDLVIGSVRTKFFDDTDPGRTGKHFADPLSGSSAKRINMYLRWMVRSDLRGVDFGIWKNFPSRNLMCPLDVHSGRVARELGLLKRQQNDWKAVEELTESLRRFDPLDPVRFDFALFGGGVTEK